MALAGGCTGWENVCGTSKFAAAPVVTDPFLVSMAGGVPDRLARLANYVRCGDLSIARLPPSRMASDGGCTGGENVPRKTIQFAASRGRRPLPREYGRRRARWIGPADK